VSVTRSNLAAELLASHLVTVDHFVPLSVCRRMLFAASGGDWIPSGVAGIPNTRHPLVAHATGRSSSTLILERYSSWMGVTLRRIEQLLLITFGIEPRHLELWQVTRYKRGEAYDYHLDCGCWRRHPSGERRRTILIYLEQPARGGATDFRALHKSIPAVAGRLVVWDNLLPSGNCNYAMIHSGRPVWQGRKTILTTWEREGPYVR